MRNPLSELGKEIGAARSSDFCSRLRVNRRDDTPVGSWLINLDEKLLQRNNGQRQASKGLATGEQKKGALTRTPNPNRETFPGMPTGIPPKTCVKYVTYGNREY